MVGFAQQQSISSSRWQCGYQRTASLTARANGGWIQSVVIEKEWSESGERCTSSVRGERTRIVGGRLV